MTRRRLGTVTLLVDDLDRAAAWFRDALGFAVIEDQTAPGGRRWLRVAPDAEASALLLVQPTDPAQAAMIGRQGAGRVWLFLETADFAADHARMSAAGVTFEEAPRHEDYGTVCVFRDPWGNRWDLLQPASGPLAPPPVAG